VDVRRGGRRAQPADEGHRIDGRVAQLRDALVLILVDAYDQGAALAGDALRRVALRDDAASAGLLGEGWQGIERDGEGEQREGAEEGTHWARELWKGQGSCRPVTSIDRASTGSCRRPGSRSAGDPRWRRSRP